MKETALQREARLALSRAGHVFWRNNVGGAEFWNEHAQDVDHVAYGVGGPGGADLIGVVTMPSGIGRIVAIEMKAPGARTKPARAALQAQFRRLVNDNGGYADVARTPDEAVAIAGRARAGAML